MAVQITINGKYFKKGLYNEIPFSVQIVLFLGGKILPESVVQNLKYQLRGCISTKSGVLFLNMRVVHVLLP